MTCTITVVIIDLFQNSKNKFQGPLLEGPVKRTKFFEGGKKSKKNWTDGYMILTPTALYFYKDYKTYHVSFFCFFILQYICQYGLIDSSVTKNDIVYIVLSIVVSIMRVFIE